MEHYNRSQEGDGMSIPVPLSNYNPQHPQNSIRPSAFSKPFSSPPSSLIPPKNNIFATTNGSCKDSTTPSTNSKQLSPDLPTPKYRECLRNHAASNGGHVLDGCGEFMPSSTDPLKCAACDCHRSFHRRISDSDLGPFYRKRMSDRVSVPLLLPPPPLPHHQKPQQFIPTSAFPISPSVAYGGNNSGSGATTESSSEERMEAGDCEPLSSHQMEASPMIVSRKRFRTKFTSEQKEKMTAFAERLGWRFQRQDDATIEQFSKESGIRRQVLKVWMHNNKHSLRKQQPQLQPQPQPQPQLQPQPQQQPQLQQEILQQHHQQEILQRHHEQVTAIDSAPVAAAMFGNGGA